MEEKKIEDDTSIYPENDSEFDDYGASGFEARVVMGSIGPCKSVIHNTKLKLNWEDIKTGLEI